MAAKLRLFDKTMSNSFPEQNRIFVTVSEINPFK
jgi:hypothetical protein